MNLNGRAMAIVGQLLERADFLGIEVHRLPGGGTVVDMGVRCPGSWEAALMFIEATLGGLGRATYGTFSLDDSVVLPEVNVYVDRPAVACLASQLSGWSLAEAGRPGGLVPMVSGPARAVARADKFAQAVTYAERASEVVVAVQSAELPGEPLVQAVAAACGVPAAGVYVLAARTGSLVGMVQVASRTVETALWRLHCLGFPVERVLHAWGKAPVPPPVEDEFEALVRVNTCTYYGGTVFFAVEEDDRFIESVVDRIPLSPRTCRNYGVNFAELLRQAGGDILKVDPDVHSVCRVVINNVRSGRTYVSGRPDLAMVSSCLGMGTGCGRPGSSRAEG